MKRERERKDIHFGLVEHVQAGAIACTVDVYERERAMGRTRAHSFEEVPLLLSVGVHGGCLASIVTIHLIIAHSRVPLLALRHGPRAHTHSCTPFDLHPSLSLSFSLVLYLFISLRRLYNLFFFLLPVHEAIPTRKKYK